MTRLLTRTFLFLFLLSACVADAEQPWTLPTPAAPPSGVPRNLLPYPSRLAWGSGQVKFSSVIWDAKELSPALSARLSPEWNDVAASIGIPSVEGEGSLRVVLEQRVGVASNPPLQREAYTLSVSAKGVKIDAGDFAGFFNALQTLRQLIQRAQKNGWQIPHCEIQDEPAFQIRGVMLDVGRNYMEVPLIKEIVRKLSCYKINTLHLHLTDDPAWRFEVKQFPQLTERKHFWPTRQPGKFYTQAELRELIAYCAALNVRVIPEIDMPGHSAAFARAMGSDMQTPQGLAAMKAVVVEAASLFPDPWFHIGSDESRVTMKNFLPEMIAKVREQNKEVIVWYPGHVPDKNAVLMCWGENESSHSLAGAKGQRYIDCNGFYLDWMDSQSGVLQTFFQQPCEVACGNDHALGGELAVWTDGALGWGRRVLEQYPFYPVALTFAERLWRGAHEKRTDLMAAFPQKGTPAWAAIEEFEHRLTWHRDNVFRSDPFAYVRQAEMQWRLIGPFDHKGTNDTSFEPERIIKEEYATEGGTLRWQTNTAYGGAIWLRHLFAMFNMHRNQYRLDHWPTVMSPQLGKNPGTCYALACVESPVEQDVYFMFGLNGMWGHSGGYRSARAPEPGSWDFSGGNVWVNDAAVPAPDWKFKSLPWTGWGKGRIEVPLTEEGYFFRPPVKIHLRKGVNKILVRSVFGHWKGDDGERKWFFCAMPVNWDGRHFTEATNLSYPDILLNGRKKVGQ